MNANSSDLNSSAIPNPPPLPAPRTLQRARDAANKFFGYQTSHSPSPEDRVKITSHIRSRSSRYAALGTGNATASHKTGLEINTIALNEKGTHALVGGKEIFKTIKVEDGVCAEDLNLRSAIRSTPRTASGDTRKVFSIDIADVAWARGDCNNYVAAATSSGKIILYDVGHAGLQAAQLHEHFRHVHKVTFNPHRGSLLLSGSQDGTVRLWDVRDVRSANVIQSKRKYSGLGDGVRDVKWSPTEGVEFAFGTDSGWVQCWDMRNLKAPKIKLSAHDSSCNAVDWHPDGKHILSAGADKTVRVWNLSANTKRARSAWLLTTPHPVFNARWRPSCETLFNKDSSARQCTQVVTSYDRDHPSMHIWDLRRPALPFRELSPYPTAPTDFTWHSQDLLWTVGREGVFLQADIQHTPKSMDRRNLQSFAISPKGEISCFTQRRYHALIRRQSVPAPGSFSDSSSLSQSPGTGSYERSWTDDSLDNLFLSSQQLQEQSDSPRKSRASSITSGSDRQPPTVKLDDVLHNRKSFRPDQAAIRGILPIIDDPRLLPYLARQYEFTLTETSDNDEFITCLKNALQKNAAAAQQVSLYRLAQTWDIVRVIFLRHLRARAEMRAKASKERRNKNFELKRDTLGEIAKRLSRDQVKSPSQTPASTKPMNGHARHLAVPESSSNVPTPQAKPIASEQNHASDREHLPDPDKEQLALPPLLAADEEKPFTARATPVDVQRRLTTSNLTGLIKAQSALNAPDKGDMVRRWSVQPKQPLDLDVKDANGQTTLPKLEKHDSNESFNFLEPLSDSREASFPSSFGSPKSGKSLQMVSERPSRQTNSTSAANAERIESHDFEDGAKSLSTAAVPIPEPNNHTAQRRPMAGIFNERELAERRQRVPEQSRTEAAFGNDSYPDENGIINVYQANDRGRSRLSAEITKPVAEVAHIPTKTWAAPREASKPPTAQPVLQKAPDERLSLYHPRNDDLDIESEKPFTLVSMIEELVTYYASHADVQTAASLILLLAKLLPRTHPLSAEETEATVLSCMDGFAAAGFDPDETIAALNGDLDHIVKCGLKPLQIESILSTYHDRLVANRMWNEAAELRKICYPAYPSIYEDYLQNNSVNLHCGACGEPLPSERDTLRCEKCDSKQGACPVCWCATSPFEETNRIQLKKASSSLLTMCLLCGHSGHAACLRMWFDKAGVDHGGCPTTGCLCDCVDGSSRREQLTLLERERRLRDTQKINADPWKAVEAPAVERARKMLDRDVGKAGVPRGSSA